MASASIEVSGPESERLAGELRAALARVARPGEVVSPVEVARSAELVVAVIGLVFSGVGTARTIWEWWQASRSSGVTVKILMADGTRVDLSGMDEQRLVIELDQRSPSSQ